MLIAKEAWLSGRKRRRAKALYPQGYRRFESSRLRFCGGMPSGWVAPNPRTITLLSAGQGPGASLVPCLPKSEAATNAARRLVANSNPAYGGRVRRIGKALVLKTSAPKGACGFESHPYRHGREKLGPRKGFAGSSPAPPASLR